MFEGRVGTFRYCGLVVALAALSKPIALLLGGLL